MVFGLGKRDIVIEQEEKAQIAIAVREEKRRQARLRFERKKARVVARVRSPLSKKFRGIAVKAGKRARKDIGKSIRGFAQKIGKPSEAEKETVVIIGGRPKSVKGRVRVIREQQEPFGSGLDVGGELGLNVDLFGEKPRKRKQKPFRFF